MYNFPGVGSGFFFFMIGILKNFSKGFRQFMLMLFFWG